MTVPPAEPTGTAGPAGSAGASLRRVGPRGDLAADGTFGVALTGLWHDVSQAGGSVGFVPPVERPAVAAKVAVTVDALRAGKELAVAAIADRKLVGFGILRPGTGLQAHTGYLGSLMVLPDLGGNGLGSTLLTELIGWAREIGLERLELSARDGMGLETFYRRFGFVEWGRRPGWIRVAAGDGRDEIFYWLDLRSPGPGESG